MNRIINTIFNRYRKNEDGVAVIEAAMILPVAVLMFIGIFEAGQMLLLNQKVYAASHMVGDLLARKAQLTNDDLEEAYAAGQMIIEPFDNTSLRLDIVGVQYDDAGDPQKVWQKSYNTPGNPNLYQKAIDLGSPGEGAIVVGAAYTYNPVFANLDVFSDSGPIFKIMNMEEISVLRGRINSCLGLDDGGTISNCTY